MTMDDHNGGRESRTFLGLGDRLVLWFAMFAIVPVTLVLFASHLMITAHLEHQTEKLMKGIVAGKGYGVEHGYHDMGENLDSLSRRSATLAMMEAADGKTTLSPSEIKDLKKEFEKNILPQHVGNETYKDVFLINRNGVVLYSKNGGFHPETSLFDGVYADTALTLALKKALHSGTAVFSDFEDAGESFGLSGHGVRALQNRVGELTGLIAVRFGLEGMIETLENDVDLGKTFALYLEGPKGRLKMSTGEWQPTRLPLVSRLDGHGAGSQVPGAGTGSSMHRYEAEDGTVRLWVGAPLAVTGVDYRLVAEINETDAFAVKKRAGLTLLLLSVILAVLMAGGAWVIADRVTRPIKDMGEWAEAVATGDLSMRKIACPYADMNRFIGSFTRVVTFLNDTARIASDVSSGDYSGYIELRSPHDALGASFRRMTESLRDAASAMESLAAGDFYAQVKVKGPNDLFARSLNSMVERIRETHEQGRVHARQKSLQAELNEIMRGDKPIEELCRKVLSFFCLCLKAVLGTFYVREDDGDTLKLYGGFALSSHRSFPQVIRAGEGLAGQALTEKRKILLSQCPESYLNAGTLVCDLKTSSVLVYPFVRDGRVEGLMELGAPGRFAARDMEFLDLVSESVAISIASAVARMTMKDLLDKTVIQAGDLRLKQEELNVINRDLKDQTEKLQASEKQLRAKEEEMTRINAALEEQTFNLQRQQEEIREKNNALEAAQAALIEKTRNLESGSRHKSEFLASMSHELRTPLNSILLISRLLEENRQGNLTEKQIEFARTIHSAGEDLHSLIDDILDLSRIEAGKLELVRTKVRVRDLETKIRLHFGDVCREKGIVLKTEIHEDVPENVHVDLKRIDQVLKNLVSNAVKFTSRGSVTVRFSMPPLLGQGGRFTADTERSLRISVHDTGKGIAGDKHELVFEPFQQADDSIGRTFGGTGLGLSISRKLVRLMGGDITLESAEGEGSTFTVHVPDAIMKPDQPEPDDIPLFTAAGTAAPPEEDPDGGSARDLEGLRILIADDDMRHVYALIHYLENRGPEVVVAKTGGECLDILWGAERVDLVIMDVLMKDMSGFEAMSRIRGDDRFKNLPVVAVTARAMKGDREKCLETGASAYISKPVDMDGLMKIMKDLLRRTSENEI